MTTAVAVAAESKEEAPPSLPSSSPAIADKQPASVVSSSHDMKQQPAARHNSKFSLEFAKTPKHRNTTKMDDDDGDEEANARANTTKVTSNLDGSSFRPIANADMSNIGGGGSRRFPGMRSAVPPPEYTSYYRRNPSPYHHPYASNAAGSSYEDYIHDLSAPLPAYDVPSSSHYHHLLRGPRETLHDPRVMDYPVATSASSSRYHLYGRHLPSHHSSYYGFYDHHYLRESHAAADYPRNASGWEGHRGGRAATNAGAAPAATGENGANSEHHQVVTTEEGGNEGIQAAITTNNSLNNDAAAAAGGNERSLSALRAVSGSFSVNAINSSQSCRGDDELVVENNKSNVDSTAAAVNDNDDNRQNEVVEENMKIEDKDIAVVLASMEQDSAAVAAVTTTTTTVPKNDANTVDNDVIVELHRNDELEVTSSISHSPDDHHCHPRAEAISITRKKQSAVIQPPAPSKLHYMSYPLHHHQQQQQRRLRSVTLPPPPVVTASGGGGGGRGYTNENDEESPSASTISTRVSHFVLNSDDACAAATKTTHNNVESDSMVIKNDEVEEERGGGENEEEERDDPPPSKRQRRSSLTSNISTAAAGGGGDGLPDLSGMPSWETTRTASSSIMGPGTISAWSICSTLGAGVGIDGGESAGADATSSGGSGKDNDAKLKISDTTSGDGDYPTGGELNAFSFASDNFGRVNGATSTFSLPSATGVGCVGEDDISPKSILSRDGKIKKVIPQGTHVQFYRADEGSTTSASATATTFSSNRKRMAPHLLRSYDDYYDYPLRYHHPHPYYDSPVHHPHPPHHRSRYHPADDPYYSDPHYHPYPPPTTLRHGRQHHLYHHGPPPPPPSHYYDRYPPHDAHEFPPSPSPTHHHRHDQLGGGAVVSESRSGESGFLDLVPPFSSSSACSRGRTPRSSFSSSAAHATAADDDMRNLRLKNVVNTAGWSKEDDTALLSIMKSGKEKNPRSWTPIGHQLGRSPDDCRERWTRCLKPGARKGQWTEEEDAAVIRAVESAGGDGNFTRWSQLALRLPGRVGKQVRDRWVNHLNPNINHLPFSREDDLLLWEGHSEVGKRWVEISTKFFKGTRSENHIKNRWYSASFKKFIITEFGEDSFVGESHPGV